MKIRRRIVLVSVFAAAAAVAGALMFSGPLPDATSNRNRELERVLLDPNTPLDQALTAAGFPAEFVETFSSVTTELVSSTANRYHIVQRIPALSIRRDTRIAIHPDKQLQPGVNKTVKTAAGFNIYPLHHAVVGFPGGYDRYQAFFVAYDAFDPELIDRLGLRRGAARRREWNILPVGYAQSALLGMVVASVTTAQGGDTAVPERTQPPTLSEAELRRAEDVSVQQELEARRQAYLDQNYNGSQEAYIQQYDEYQQRYWESLDSETRARLQREPADPYIETRAQREARLARELADLQGEIELNNLLRDGETLRQREARVALERDAARLQRVGNGLAVLQALAEWMQQALDYGDWNRQLAAAEACLDQRAQNAGPDERANIELVRGHLRAARSDLNWNTGVRVANSGNNVASSIVIPGAAGGAMGLYSSGANAQLRELTAQSLADAIRGVGNCDPPPPCPEPPRDRPPTEELLYTPSNQQTYTPGPERRPPPDLRCSPPRAVIEMRYTRKTETSTHITTFNAAADLTNLRPVQVGGVSLQSPDSDFHGTGRAIYQEQLDGWSEGFNGQRCEQRLRRSGQPKADVVVRMNNREVSVKLVGPLQTSWQHPCGGSEAPAPTLECYFENVDVDRGGVFKADDQSDFNNGADDFHDFECTLTLAPLRGKAGRGLTSAPVAGADPRRR